MSYGEERFVCVGMMNGLIHYVAYTERGDIVRIISARRVTPMELRKYDRERQG